MASRELRYGEGRGAPLGSRSRSTSAWIRRSATARMSTISAARPFGPQRLPPDGDRREKSRRPWSPRWRPNGGPRTGSESVRPLGWPRFRLPRLRCIPRTPQAQRRCLPHRRSRTGCSIAFDHENVDLPPLGVEVFLRSTTRRMGTDRSDVAQLMNSLDDILTSAVRSKAARKYAFNSSGANVSRPPVVDIKHSSVIGSVSFRWSSHSHWR